MTSLRQFILEETGQDLRHCRGCLACDFSADEMDIHLSSIVQLVLMNDDEVLTSRTLWSEPVLELARTACIKNLNLEKIILALRGEAVKRGA